MEASHLVMGYTICRLMNSLAVSTMLFGALLFIPYVLGKDAGSELTKLSAKMLDYHHLPHLLPTGLIKEILSIWRFDNRPMFLA